MEFSYSISDQLRQSLTKIDYLRAKIYLAPLTIKEELRLRWEAGILRTFFTLSLVDLSFSKNEVVKILTLQGEKVPPRHKPVLNYKKALDFIYWEYLSSQKNVNVKAIYDIYDIIRTKHLRIEEGKVRRLLDYLSANPATTQISNGASPDHPIIQAGILHEEILFLSPFRSQNKHMSSLLTLLFLYNRGYDFRGLLVLEEYLRKNIVSYSEVLSNVSQTRNLTLWLEYFAAAIISQLEGVLKVIESQDYRTNLPAVYFELNDRQKHILTFLEEPGLRITNKKVQSIFNISQITASRDLAHLKILGLLISHGKGRSVYYTRSN